MLKTIKQNCHKSYFKRWTRNSWALFSSQKREIIISFLAISLNLVLLPKTEAQSPEHVQISDTLETDAITITAEKLPLELMKTTKTIQVINAESLRSLPQNSLDNMLRSNTLVDVRQRGGNGVQSDISIRGGNYEQTLFLLNGIYFNDPQSGHFNMSLPLDIESVDRVELLYGSSSRVYGNIAMSGAINFISNPQNDNFLNLSLHGGQNGFYKYSIGGNFTTKNSKHYISLSRSSSDGYMANTDFESNSLYYSTEIDLKTSKLEYQLGLMDRNYGANSFYSAAYPNQFEDVKTALSSLKWSINLPIQLETKIFWRGNVDRFELFRGMKTAPEWYSQHNYHQSNMFGFGLGTSKWHRFGKTSLGVDFRNESISSTVLGDSLRNTRKYLFENIDLLFGKNRNISSIYIDHLYIYKRLSSSFGINSNYYSSLKSWGFFPGADLSFSVSDKSLVFLSINSAMRLPSFTDLYYESPNLIGNRSLSAEKSITYEVGYRYVSQKHNTLNLSAFIRQANNLIDWIKYPDDQFWHSSNHTNLIYSGLEFMFYFNPHTVSEYLSHFTNLSLGYTFVNINQKSSDFQSAYVLDNLKHKFVLFGNFKLYKNLYLSYNFSLQDRNGGFWESKDVATANYVDYKPFSLSDIKLMWNDENWTVFLEVANVFDKEYFDFGGIPQAGRWIKLGGNYKIKF
ncbi:MAG: TonB-dependent receptor [Bacteroidales bacterium]